MWLSSQANGVLRARAKVMCASSGIAHPSQTDSHRVRGGDGFCAKGRARADKGWPEKKTKGGRVHTPRPTSQLPLPTSAAVSDRVRRERWTMQKDGIAEKGKCLQSEKWLP